MKHGFTDDVDLISRDPRSGHSLKISIRPTKNAKGPCQLDDFWCFLLPARPRLSAQILPTTVKHVIWETAIGSVSPTTI